MVRRIDFGVDVSARWRPCGKRAVRACCRYVRVTARSSDYDPTGWCYVRVRQGPPSFAGRPLDGPALASSQLVETLLWTDADGFLESVEVIDYGVEIADVYRRFIDAERAGTLVRHADVAMGESDVPTTT